MPAAHHVHMLAIIPAARVVEMADGMNAGNLDATALMAVVSDCLRQGAAPNVVEDGELHRALVAHRNLVETRTIEIGEIRHQARAEIRSHTAQRASEAKRPLTDISECE